MATGYVEGKNVVLEIIRYYTNGLAPDWVPFMCSTSIEFTYDTELIERATVGTASFRGWVAGLGEWGIKLNAVSFAGGPNGAYTVYDTILESLRKNGLDIRLSFQDNNANLQVITGHVLIPHTGITSPEDGLSEDDIEFKGDGAFALTTTLINPPSTTGDVKEYEYTGTGGEDHITASILINRTILYLGRSGIGCEQIFSGNPSSTQFYYNASTGTVYFKNPNTGASPSPLSPLEWVQILYK